MRLVDGVPVDAADRADVYELALSALPDTVFLATADGTLAWVCPNVSVTFGRSADTVVGEETVASLLGPELAPTAVLDGDEDLLANVDATVVGADGDPRDLLVTVRRLTDAAVETATTAGRNRPSADQGDDGDRDRDRDRTDSGAERAIRTDTDGTVYLYACRDVTERVELGRELDEVANRITESFFSVDTSLRIVHANEQFARTVGRTADGIVGERLWDLVDDPERLRAFDILPEVLATGEPAAYEGYYEPFDVWYEVNVYPSRTGLSVFSKDVTERKRRQRTLAESERRFRGLFEGSLDAVLVADDDGRYLDANPAACDLFGRDREALLGRTAADVAPPGFDFDAAWRAFLDAGDARGEFLVRRPDGEVRVADFAATAEVTPGEHVSILRDVTDRVERERLVAAQRDRLRDLADLNEHLRGVNRAVVAATTVDEMYRAVCRRFAGTASFVGAAVVGPAPAERVEVLAAAGVDADGVAAVDAVADAVVDTDRRRTDRTVAVDAAAADRLGLPGPSRVHCLPIVADGSQHGVLVAFEADDPDEADDIPGAAADDAADDDARKRAVLVELGRTVGAAVGAITARQVLHARTVTRIELATRASEDRYLALAATTPGCRLSSVEVVPVAGGRLIHYLRVTGAPPESVARAAETLPGVERARTLAAEGTGDEGVVEVVVTGGSIVGDAIAGGGHVVGVRADADCCALSIELPPEVDVGRYVRTLRRDHPDVELRSRETATVPPAGEGVRESGSITIRAPALTDRQRAALVAAHAAGYYDWPTRDTTASALAASFDLSSSTFGQHLRVATGKLVAAFVDAT